ncbi:MAG: murein L,D-transpeptidase family protein [Pyrinomonadaceae bacterium]
MKTLNVVVEKEKRLLKIFDGEILIKSYRIALGSNPIGIKEVEGDGKTPEGKYYIFTKNIESKFYLSLALSYPAIEDAKRGLACGLITQEVYDQIENAIQNRRKPPQNTPLGGEIYIHGNGNKTDWTGGCIALENSDMKEVFALLDIGTNVIIRN